MLTRLHAGVDILAIDTHDSSDGFSRKDYGSRNREQLVPAVVGCAKREQKRVSCGLGCPARQPDAKILRPQPPKKN